MEVQMVTFSYGSTDGDQLLHYLFQYILVLNLLITNCYLFAINKMK